jgi:NitT/TauT family transport system substrate-binding protein
MPGMPYALYSRKDINSLHDLQGKTLGISAPGALPEVIAKAMLLSQGISPDSVTFSNAGGDAQRFAALKGGKVDAVAAATEFVSETRTDPNIKVLALASDYVPQYPRFMLIANGNTLKNKPREAIVGFLAAHMEGLRYALVHREEALALCAKITNEPATGERCTETYDLVKEKKYVDPNMEFDLSRLTWLQDLRIRLGQQKEIVPNEKLVNLSFRDEAVQKIGRAP